MEELQNNFTNGNDDSTSDKMEEYNLLVNYKTTQLKTATIFSDDS